MLKLLEFLEILIEFKDRIMFRFVLFCLLKKQKEIDDLKPKEMTERKYYEELKIIEQKKPEVKIEEKHSFTSFGTGIFYISL